MAASALPSGLISKPNLPVLQRGHPLAQGLVGAWLFTESGAATANAGNQQYSINDWSDNRLIGLSTPSTASVSSSMQWSDGILGRAFQSRNAFGTGASGSESRVDITDPRFVTILNGNEFSFAGWARCDDATTVTLYYLLTCPSYDGTTEPFTIRVNNPSLEITTFGGGAPWASPLTTTLNFTAAVPQWFHFVVSFSKKRGTIIFFLNGKFNNSATITGSYSESSTNPFCIGGSGPNITSRAWVGAIDSILMWNRGLNADDVRLLYADQYAMFRVPSLVPPFKFVPPPPAVPLMGQIWLA
jgi:hypothetical protein